jgi:chromosome partitioning protein
VNALTAAHGVVIPLECEFFALRGVALLVETIEKVKDRLNPVLEVDGILATMYDPRTLHSREGRHTGSSRPSVTGSSTPASVARSSSPDASVAANRSPPTPRRTRGPTPTGCWARELIARGDAA